MQKPFAAAEPQIKSYDPIWSQVRREAEEISAAEPALGGFIYATVLDHARLEDAVCHRLARRLQHAALDRAPAQDVSRGAGGRALARRGVPRRPHGRGQTRPGLQPPDRATALFQRLSRARDLSHRACAVEGRPQGLCPLSAKPDVALPPGRHSPRRRDRQGRHVRPCHRHRHRRDGGDRRQLLDAAWRDARRHRQ